jgi:hypothetical protein
MSNKRSGGWLKPAKFNSSLGPGVDRRTGRRIPSVGLGKKHGGERSHWGRNRFPISHANQRPARRILLKNLLRTPSVGRLVAGNPIVHLVSDGVALGLVCLQGYPT